MEKRKYIESEGWSIVLFLFIFLMYAVVYMTKSMFSSAMATIVEEGFMTKSQTGLINAVFWFVYALFQVIGGFTVDKYSPNKLVMIGLGGALVSNIVIYLNQDYPVMMAAWAFNAMAQFGVWPGVFKIISTKLAPSVRRPAVFWMLFSTSVGLGLSMLIASFVSHWKQNFLISVISLLICMILFAVLNRCTEKRMVDELPEEDAKEEKQKSPMRPLLFSSGLFVLMFVCLLRVAVDNGIKMMTPVMLMESYEKLPAALATRLSSILILFSAIGTMTAGLVQKTVTKNEMKAQMLFYGVCLIPLTVVCFIGEISYLWILVALSFSVLLMQGASPFSQSYAALHFDKYGRIGTVSGILNAMASVGNVMASYIFAKMSELMPWKGVAGCWLAVVVVCFALCAFVLPRWSEFVKK